MNVDVLLQDLRKLGGYYAFAACSGTLGYHLCGLVRVRAEVRAGVFNETEAGLKVAKNEVVKAW